VLIAGLLALAALAALALLPAAPSVTVGRVERGAMRVTLDEEGEVRAHDRYVVAAPVAGRLLRVELHAGDPVTAGTVVAHLAPLPLSAREHGEQIARVQAARALRAEAEGNVLRARSNWEQAQRDLRRAEQLAAQGYVAEQMVEERHLAETTARAELTEAEFRARSAAAEVEVAEAGLLGAEGGDGEPPVIDLRTPVDGTVLRTHEQSERVLPVGAPILTVGDPSRFEIVVDYLTTDAVQIRPGMPMLLEGWGGPPLRARVRLVEPGAFTKVSALGVEEQRTNVLGDFVDPPGPLGDGYRVEARVVVWESPDALKVPASAVFRAGDGWAVFVLEGRRVRRRALRVGPRNAAEVEVLDGVTEGERVIRHPPNALDDGARVSPVEGTGD
jgi:HlyD family secretion protein